MQNNNKHLAAMAAAATVSTMQSIISSNTIAVTAILQQSSEDQQVQTKKGRYLRSGAVPNRVESVWFKVDNYGDELEFLHFTSHLIYTYL